MTTEQIKKKLDEMYNGANGARNFVNHLIRAYFPVDKVDKVWETPAVGGKFRCSITNEPLFSVGDVMNYLRTDESKNSFIASLKAMVEKPNEPMTSHLNNEFKAKKFGVTGEKTDTFLALPTYHAFQEWIADKIFSGDSHINRLIKQMRDKAYEDSLPEEVKAERQKVREIMQKSKGLMLGDIDVLQQLKAKLESEGK